MRRFRRFRGTKKAPLRLAWVNTLFAETSMNVDASTYASQVLLNGTD